MIWKSPFPPLPPVTCSFYEYLMKKITEQFKQSRRGWHSCDFMQGPMISAERFLFFSLVKMIWKSPFPPLPPVTCSLYEYLMKEITQTVEHEPNRVALENVNDSEKRLTYEEVKNHIHSIEGFLQSRGFAPGDVGSVVILNCIELLPIFLAVLGRGGVFNGQYPLVNSSDLKTGFLNIEAKVVFTSSRFLDNVGAATKGTSVQTIVCIDEFEGNHADNMFSWNSVLSSNSVPPRTDLSHDDVILLNSSSGTTGPPKGVMITNRNYLSVVLAAKMYFFESLPEQVLPADEVEDAWKRPQLNMLPLYHFYGNVMSIFYLILGTKCVIGQAGDFDALVEAIEKHKIWQLFLSPPIILKLTKDAGTEKHDLSSLRYVNSSAAPLGRALAEEFKKKFPQVVVTQALAMSEALLTFTPCIDKENLNYGVVGPGYEAKIIAIEANGHETRVQGEVLVRGDGVMRGYFKNEEATQAAIDVEGWYHTGDIGYFNEKGQLFLLDRLKDMIKVYSGHAFQVAPAELESVLTADPRIADAAVVGVPHETRGEAPKAFVVRGSSDLTEDDVKQIVKDKMAEIYSLEGGVVFTDSIPRLPSGKILRRQLHHLEKIAF